MITLFTAMIMSTTLLAGADHHGQSQHGDMQDMQHGDMQHEGMSEDGMMDHGEHGMMSTTWADVRMADAEHRTTMMRHGPLDELGMPGMVMEFQVADDVDFDLFQPGASLTVTVTNGEDGLVVVAAEPGEEG